MIGALDRRPHVARLVDELETAVAADVVERADLQIGIAHQQHRPAGDGDRHDIARPGQLMGKAGEDPGVGEDALVL